MKREGERERAGMQGGKECGKQEQTERMTNSEKRMKKGTKKEMRSGRSGK